jgi:hypothetical protein
MRLNFTHSGEFARVGFFGCTKGKKMNFFGCTKGKKMKLHAVEIKPTWVNVMPILLAVIANPNASPLAVEGVTAELMRLAEIGDSVAD